MQELESRSDGWRVFLSERRVVMRGMKLDPGSPTADPVPIPGSGLLRDIEVVFGGCTFEVFFGAFLALSWERLTPLPCSAELGLCSDEPLTLVSEETSKVGLLEVFPDLPLETGGGGGAGLGLANFPFSLSPGTSEEFLSLRGLHSSPRGGSTLGLNSSACKALVLELSVRRLSFGVRVKGLDPGLDSESLNTSSGTSESGFLGRRGGGVRVPPRDTQSAFLRGRAGFPPKVPESKWDDWISRGKVTDFHSVRSDPGGILEAEDDLKKRLEFDMGSSSAGGVVASFAPLPFFREWYGKSWPGYTRAPLVIPTIVVLLDPTNLERSMLSLSLQSEVSPLWSRCPSIFPKELLRLGGAGAVLFFFLIKLNGFIRNLSLARRRSSSFRLLSRTGLGSIGNPVTSASAASGKEYGFISVQKTPQNSLRVSGERSLPRLSPSVCLRSVLVLVGSSGACCIGPSVSFLPFFPNSFSTSATHEEWRWAHVNFSKSPEAESYRRRYWTLETSSQTPGGFQRKTAALLGSTSNLKREAQRSVRRTCIIRLTGDLLISVLRSLAPTQHAWKFQVYLLRPWLAGSIRVGAKLCKTPALRDRVWWPLYYAKITFIRTQTTSL